MYAARKSFNVQSVNVLRLPLVLLGDKLVDDFSDLAFRSCV